MGNTVQQQEHLLQFKSTQESLDNKLDCMMTSMEKVYRAVRELEAIYADQWNEIHLLREAQAIQVVQLQYILRYLLGQYGAEEQELVSSGSSSPPNYPCERYGSDEEKSEGHASPDEQPPLLSPDLSSKVPHASCQVAAEMFPNWAHYQQKDDNDVPIIYDIFNDIYYDGRPCVVYTTPTRTRTFKKQTRNSTVEKEPPATRAAPNDGTPVKKKDLKRKKEKEEADDHATAGYQNKRKRK